ncbi:MAG TPA: serine hydrolase domain-containing protein [Anaerolineales bacterium]|nr:serine hydrolase domain-containing protein [Anaerolineales bacterium]
MIQSHQSDKIDALIESEMKRLHIPGLSLAVAQDSKILKEASYGYACVEFRSLATAKTSYKIASATKSLTAAAVMLLVERGKGNVSDPIVQHLRDLPDTWKPVTVAHLLSHTSGLPDVLARPGEGPVLYESYAEAMQELVRKPVSAPGEHWVYNQTNYMLLQELIERWSGMPFTDFVEKEIFERLRLNKVVFGSRTVVSDHAYHYEVDATGTLSRAGYEVAAPPFLYAGAGLSMTAGDLMRFAESLRKHELLTESTVTSMWQGFRRTDGTTELPMPVPLPIEYGYGFLLDSRPNHRSAGHPGADNAAFRIFWEDRLTVVVLHNGSLDIPDLLVYAVAAQYVPALAIPRT